MTLDTFMAIGQIIAYTIIGIVGLAVAAVALSAFISIYIYLHSTNREDPSDGHDQHRP